MLKLYGGGNKAFFVSCNTCFFEYAVPNLPGDAEFYTIAFENDVNYPDWKWDFETAYQKIFKKFKSCKNKQLRILDIAAGNGSFLVKIAEKLGLNKANIIATELSDYGIKKIRENNIKCITTHVYDADHNSLGNNYDIICMFQFLEHSNELYKIFDTINRITNKEAEILITVPNNKHRLYFEAMGIVEDVPPVHIGRWRRENFEYIGNYYGWKLADYQLEPITKINIIAKYLNLKYRDSWAYLFIKKTNSRNMRKALWPVFYFVFALFNIKIMFKCLTDITTDLGVSQFIQFKKTA